MPSPPSPRLLRPRSRGGRSLLLLPIHVLLPAAALLAGACATSPAPAPRPVPPPGPGSVVERERSYLLDPLEGYPATVGATPAERLRTAHRAILDQGDAGARAGLATADDLL